MSTRADGIVVKCYQRAHLDPGPKRVKSSGTCDACGKATAHGKHACEDHLDRMPYAAGVMARVSAIESETAALTACLESGRVTRISRMRALRLETPVLDQETSLALAMRTLEAGGVTVERLRRLVPHVTYEVVELLLHRLRIKGFAVSQGRTKRGSDLWASTAKGLRHHAEALL